MFEHILYYRIYLVLLVAPRYMDQNGFLFASISYIYLKVMFRVDIV